MTNGEYLQPDHEPAGFDRNVLEYFLERLSEDQNFTRRLAKKLWLNLTSEEKDAVSVTHASFFPDDLVGRQNSINAQLIVDYIRTETATANQLEKAYSSLPDELAG